jgi:hypothetical protein
VIGWWLLWVAAGVVLGLLAFFVGQPKFSRWYHKKRRKLFGRAVVASGSAWRARGHSTARGRLREQRREQRRQEPYRLTFGHRRRPDDPPLVRRAARKAKEAGGRGVDRAKLSWANRTPISERVDRRNAYRDMGPQMMCGSTRTENGHPCRNPRMIGKDHCQVHPRFSTWFSRRDEEGMSRWEQRRLKREQEAEEKRWSEEEARRRDRQDRDRERAEQQPDRNGNGSGPGRSAEPVGRNGGSPNGAAPSTAQPVSSGADGTGD